MKRDYYEVLGVSRDAGPEDLKRAYRRLAVKYHPDKNPDDRKAAEDRFKELNEAYQVLSDPERRAQYDRFGHAAFEQEGVGFGFPSGFEDIIGDLFGDFFGTGRSRGSRSRARRGEDLQYRLELSFEEAARGCERTLQFARMHVCETCKGSGAKPGTSPSACSHCRGTGQLRLQQGFFSIAKTCGYCGGRGSVVKSPCGTCGGTGATQQTHTLNVKVPAGVDSGSRLKLRGEGEPGQAGGPPGDLYVLIEVAPHPLFQRDGVDIVCEVPISFVRAALGTELEVPTLDGSARVKVPAGTQSGHVFRLRGRGIPHLGGYGTGDQLVRVVVETPRKLTPRQRELLEEFARISGDDHPRTKSFLDKVKSILE
ncbi:MAG TPA: molecular chaperone DnaJ [Candidatus Limnocylindria bacterium]|nr:molecular chaperone DnaJ [Candidatus Limnocylindria bacterium]